MARERSMDEEAIEQAIEPQETQRSTTRQLRAKLERQQYRCFFTGQPLTPDSLAIDHLLSISEGGDDRIHNLVLVHAYVNMAKGTMSATAFIRMCNSVSHEWQGREPESVNECLVVGLDAIPDEVIYQESMRCDRNYNVWTCTKKQRIAVGLIKTHRNITKCSRIMGLSWKSFVRLLDKAPIKGQHIDQKMMF